MKSKRAKKEPVRQIEDLTTDEQITALMQIIIHILVTDRDGKDLIKCAVRSALDTWRDMRGVDELH